MKNKGIKFRDLDAIAAHFRNSAGPLAVKKHKEERNACRDFRKNWRTHIPDEDGLDDIGFEFEFEEQDDTEE